MSPVFTVDDVAQELKVTAYTVREWLKMGKLRGRKYGKAWRVLPEDLEAFKRGEEPPRESRDRS